MGPPQGSAKLKEAQVLLRIVIAIKQFGAHCENVKYFITISILSKTSVFFSFCFFVLLSVGTALTKVGP